MPASSIEVRHHQQLPRNARSWTQCLPGLPRHCMLPTAQEYTEATDGNCHLHGRRPSLVPEKKLDEEPVSGTTDNLARAVPSHKYR